MSAFWRLATLQALRQAYVRGQRIWLHKTSEGDAEKGWQ